MNVEAVLTVVMAVAMAVAMAFVAAGCGGSGDESSVTTGAISYQNDIQPIWDRNCVGCHSGGDLDLRAGTSFDSLANSTVSCFVPADGTVVERPAVVPGDPAGSALRHKLANVDFDCGREMPATGTGGLIAIDRDAFDLVEEWIADGAPEN